MPPQARRPVSRRSVAITAEATTPACCARHRVYDAGRPAPRCALGPLSADAALANFAQAARSHDGTAIGARYATSAGISAAVWSSASSTVIFKSAHFMNGGARRDTSWALKEAGRHSFSFVLDVCRFTMPRLILVKFIHARCHFLVDIFRPLTTTQDAAICPGALMPLGCRCYNTTFCPLSRRHRLT